MERHLFEAGARYRVKQSFMSGTSVFVADELLTFKSGGYSWYDNCFAFEFHSQTDGTDKVWWLHHDEPADSWQRFFELFAVSSTGPMN